MVSYGCTRLEIGVQSTYEYVAHTNRGHTVAAVVDCFSLAKHAGFKMSASWPHRRGKGPMTRGMRPDGFAGIEEPVDDTTAQREGRTHKRKVTGSTRRGERNLRLREPEAHTDEDDDDSHVGFEGQYVYPVPDFGLDDNDDGNDVGNTVSASPTTLPRIVSVLIDHRRKVTFVLCNR
ncbi:hypothetical protein ACP275_09G068900 [Erythranthe tilingii]